MRKVFLLFYFLINFLCTRAQEPKFIQHDLGNAFKDIPINVMIQDSQCMIWLGTSKGLVRYDGNSTYQVKLDLSGIEPEVTSLFEDKDRRIWVGTEKGLIYYLDISRNAHAFNPREGCPEKKITAIVQDNRAQIWFATYGEGVYVWTGTRLFNMNTDDCLSGNDIYDMASLENGEVWLGTDDGITICSFNQEKKEYRHLGLADGLPDQIITALKADQNGNVWIGTFEYGVCFYNNALQKITLPFESHGIDEVTSFEIFDNQEIWIGTKSKGVWRYNPQFEFIRKVVGLELKKSFEVSGILSDIEGNIWISMQHGALWSAFRQFESYMTDIGEIQAVFCDRMDKLWIGTDKGLFRMQDYIDASSKPIRIAPSYDFTISSIVEDDFHNLWIATLDKGLIIYTPSTGKFLEISSSISKLGSTIMSMDRSKNDIWIATNQSYPSSGVFSYPINKDITRDKGIHFENQSDALHANLQYVFQVFVDSRDRAWIATDGNGVYCIDSTLVKHYKGNDSITLKKVFSICEDQEKHIWINTHEWGLIELSEDTMKPLNVSEGLTTMNVQSIVESKGGDILISYNYGIDLLEPERRHFMYYAPEIGAEDFEPSLNSVATDSRGNVYIGGKNMIMKYYGSNHKFSTDPSTIITQVKVDLKPIDFKTKNTFSHSENSFSFDYIGLWYTSPHSVNYKYSLSPIDSTFRVSKDYSASYSNLPPGHYTFTVKASENKDFFSEPIDSYSFTIERPFFRELWFILPMLVITGLIIYWMIKSRDRRIQRQAMVKKEMIESQLQALKAQINPHFLFNSFNTLITIIDENTLKPQVAIEYVEKLSDFFRSILQYREQETISLEEEWDMVQNFGYLLEKRYGSSLRLHLDPPRKDAYILPMTLQMLVENAVKHNVITETKPLDVYITIDDDHYITVKNNLQPKSKTEPSTQFGLQSILRRYQMMDARKVLIEKNHNSFIVRIPILKKSSE